MAPMNLNAIQAAIREACFDGHLFHAQANPKQPGTRVFLLS